MASPTTTTIMDDEVDRLVVGPFREIIEKGNVAIENSQNAGGENQEVMLKAAQALVKEGERALKRIEPLCAKYYAEYANVFIDTIKENDEIAQHRSELQDLLWDFDEVVEADQFDPETFDNLQKASRKAAPKIMDILKRMRLGVPTSSPRHSSHGVSSPSSPTDQLLDQVIRMGIRAGPDEGIDGPFDSPSVNGDDRSRRSHRSLTSNAPSSAPSDPLPEPPSDDPWRIGQLPLASNSDNIGEGGEQEGADSQAFADSPTLYPLSPRGDVKAPTRPQVRPDSVQKTDDDRRIRITQQSISGQSEGALSPEPITRRWTGSVSTHNSRDMSIKNSIDSSMSAARAPLGISVPPHRTMSMSTGSESLGWSSPYNQSSNRSTQDAPFFMNNSPIIPENGTWAGQHRGSILSSYGPTQPLPRPPSAAQAGRQPSTESVNSSVFDVVDYEAGAGASKKPSTHVRQSSATSIPSSPYSQYSQPPAYPGSIGHAPSYYSRSRAPSNASGTMTFRSGTTVPGYPADLETVPAGSSMDFSSGLIPVSTEPVSPKEPPQPFRQADLTIGANSSFFRLKGFCKGAEESMRGGPGYKKYKRPVGGFSYATVAKCKDCLFELDYEMAERDMSRHPSAYFTCCDVNFRLRALQKSHLPARNIDEQLYGCVFCIQAGHTMEESDATVFFSQKQLFAHLARHPRPLPQVPGLTVIEGTDKPTELAGSFDFHFPEPPVTSVMHGILPEVSRLPTAVATETKKTMHGMSAMRGPPDRTPVLQLAIGARVVGIEFPAKYEGKWGIGWHDGVRAAFEVDAVALDAPPKNEIRMQGTSNVQATARWKWSQKGDGQWLKFDKGETIKNIGSVYTDHWCWSGTTSKGWGIFPQSHIDHSSIRTTPAADDTESVSSGGGPKKSIFGLRRNTDLSLDSFLPNMSIPSLKSRDNQSITTADSKKHAHHRFDPEQIPRNQSAASGHYSVSHGPEVGRSRTMRAGL